MTADEDINLAKSHFNLRRLLFLSAEYDFNLRIIIKNMQIVTVAEESSVLNCMTNHDGCE